MGAFDEVKHEGEELVGKAKEEVGDATDNESLQAEGVYEQGKANVKQGVDKVEDELT